MNSITSEDFKSNTHSSPLHDTSNTSTPSFYQQKTPGIINHPLPPGSTPIPLPHPPPPPPLSNGGSHLGNDLHPTRIPSIPAPSIIPTPLPPPNFNSIHDDRHGLNANTSFIQPMKQSPESGPPEFHLVSVAIGPNSILKINPLDTMHLFSDASFSFLIEGDNWQNNGIFSYVGLTKSDPFIKIMRNFTIKLFRTGEISQFLQIESMKRKKKFKHSSSNNSNRSDLGLGISPSSSITGKTDADDYSLKGDDSSTTRYDNKNEFDEEEDVAAMDGLIVTKIKANKEDKTASEPLIPPPSIPSEAFSLPKILPGLGTLYNSKGSRDEYYTIVEQAVLKILPNKKVCFMLFCRFFKYVYPFVPVIDENTLLVDLNTIFVEDFPQFSLEYFKELSITSDNDLNILGAFLLVMRLGYMSLIHNDELYNTFNPDENAMISDMRRTPADTYISVVNLCTSDYLTETRSSFKLVQTLILLHFYRSVDPNDCHGLGGCDSQILFGSIIRHAMSMGLNRDPTKYLSLSSISKRTSLIRTWRLLWNYIVNLDAVSAIQTGVSPNLKSLENCDVELPHYESKTGLLKDTALNIQNICQSYRNLCNKITNVIEKPKIIEILTETSHLERLFFKLFGKDFFKEYICKPLSGNPTKPNDMNSLEHEESYLKVIKFNEFIHLRTNLSSMYYMVAIHYENEYNESKTPSMSAGIELFKIYIRSVVQLVYIMSYVLDNSVELFGKNYDYILTASNERAMIKTHSFLTSFFVRLLHIKRTLTLKYQSLEQKGELQSDPSLELRLEATDSLFRLVLIEAELFVGNFRRLGKKYINSYKLYVMAYFVLKQCIENPDRFFDATTDSRFFHEGTNMIEFLTVSELQSLCKLCEEFRVAKLELSRRQKHLAQSLNSVNTESPVDETINNVNPWKKSFNDPSSGPPLPPNLAGQDLATQMERDSSSESAFDLNTRKRLHSVRDADFLGAGTESLSIGNDDLMKLFAVYGDLDNGSFM